MERPRAVKIAVFVMCAAIVAQLAPLAAQVVEDVEVLKTETVMFYVVPSTIISAILAVGVYKRREWARTWYLILFILHVFLVGATSIHSRALMINTNIIQSWVFDIAVLYLLFRKESNTWFRFTR